MQQPGMWTKMRRLLVGSPGARMSTAPARGDSPAPETQRKDAPMPRPAPLSLRPSASAATEQLQNTYQRLVDLVDSIQRHQSEQQQRAGEIADSLMRMAETLSDIREKNTAQNDVLARVAEQLTASNDRAVRFEERVSELPDILATQRDAVLTVARQMEGAGQRDEKFVQSLGSFEQAVAALGDATTSSSVAIKNLQISTLESDERIASLLKQQNKRFVMLFSLTLLLVLAAILGPYLVGLLR